MGGEGGCDHRDCRVCVAPAATPAASCRDTRRSRDAARPPLPRTRRALPAPSPPPPVDFSILFLLPGEPLVIRARWGMGRGGACIANLYVLESREEPLWWCTSISEYAAARGSSGGKLLGGSLSICGALQVIEGSLLSQLCIAPYTGMGLLWAGGLGMILLAQIEASDPFDDTPTIAWLKAHYAVWHAVGALSFVLLSTAGVIIIATTPPGGGWLAPGIAIGGLVGFLLAVLAQNLTGNYISSPRDCCLPQRPEDRFPAGPGRWRCCHRWLETSDHRLILSRIVLFVELFGTAAIIFAVTLISIDATITRAFCANSACFRAL